jgi:thiol:disulfide interchange protein DsbD
MPAAAQMIKDPTTWTYEVKKKGGDKYDLIFHLKIQEKWHIWSLHPGGDGYEIAPSFTFNNNPKLKLDGEVTEKGTPVTTVMEGVDGKVTYFSGNVDYTQSVTLNGQGKIFGKLTYQVCNDVMCLPPKDKEFTFVVK